MLCDYKTMCSQDKNNCNVIYEDDEQYKKPDNQ